MSNDESEHVEKPVTRATDVGRIFRALGFSIQGLRYAWANEAAFRQEVLLSAVLIPVAVWLGETAIERAFLIGACLLVLIVELVNSAIEAVVDRFGGEIHPLSGSAKDLGSAAVFLSLVFLGVVWGFFLWGKVAGQL